MATWTLRSATLVSLARLTSRLVAFDTFEGRSVRRSGSFPGRAFATSALRISKVTTRTNSGRTGSFGCDRPRSGDPPTREGVEAAHTGNVGEISLGFLPAQYTIPSLHKGEWVWAGGGSYLGLLFLAVSRRYRLASCDLVYLQPGLGLPQVQTPVIKAVGLCEGSRWPAGRTVPAPPGASAHPPLLGGAMDRPTDLAPVACVR